MNSVLLSAGAACIILAVVGGGAKAFGVEVPVLSSPARQSALALVGILFLAAAYVLRGTGPGPKPDDRAVAAYRQEVLAAYRSAQSAAASGNPLFAASNNDGTFDRSRFIAALRDQLAASREVWEQLWQRPVPRQLNEEAAASHQAADDAIAETEAAIDKVPGQLSRRFTLGQFAAFANRLDAELRAPTSHFQGAMARLAGQPCNVPAPTPSG
jgi:hypothetical protein